jgi:hypothetical protein
MKRLAVAGTAANRRARPTFHRALNVSVHTAVSIKANILDNLHFLEKPERFLPVKLADLKRRMLQNERLSPEETSQFRLLFEMIDALFHFEFHKKLERLLTLYAPFDPDCDTISSPPAADMNEAAQSSPGDNHRHRPRTPHQPAPHNRASDGQPPPESELAGIFQQLHVSFEQLLVNANYEELARDQITACAQYQSRTGVLVKADFSDYAELRMFFRGVKHEPRKFRRLPAFWKNHEETAHIFSRVAMLVRLADRDQQSVFLKLFKNVVAEDLEMLLPQIRVRMRLFDQLKIGSSAAGGLITTVWKMFTAAFFSPWVFLLIVAGFVIAVVRSATSFFSSKTRYMHALTTNLYFQNLANNSSVFFHLLDAAEAEECKELLLAYYILYTERDRDYDQATLDRRIEQWLREQFGVNVEFDVVDAVAKLRKHSILIADQKHKPDSASEKGILKVLDPPACLRHLDAIWDDLFTCAPSINVEPKVGNRRMGSNVYSKGSSIY